MLFLSAVVALAIVLIMAVTAALSAALIVALAALSVFLPTTTSAAKIGGHSAGRDLTHVLRSLVNPLPGRGATRTERALSTLFNLSIRSTCSAPSTRSTRFTPSAPPPAGYHQPGASWSELDDFIGSYIKLVIVAHQGRAYCALDKDDRWFVDITAGRRAIDSLQILLDRQCRYAYNLVKNSSTDPADAAGRIARAIQIYSDKPSLAPDTTWTAEEYSLPEFQLVYIRTKAIQRFTENFTLFEAGLGDYLPGNLLSVGGGCGFEILALEQYAKKYHPGRATASVILDIVDTWRPYCEMTGAEFILGDANNLSDEGAKAVEAADCLLFSYVYRYLRPDFFTPEILSKKLLFNERGQTVTQGARVGRDFYVHGLEPTGRRGTYVMV